MKDDDLRLECVKLAYHHGREISQVLERAKQLADYVKRGSLSEMPGTSSES
jgi:hypothetical protein